jgi:hypothetical protein
MTTPHSLKLLHIVIPSIIVIPLNVAKNLALEARALCTITVRLP